MQSAAYDHTESGVSGTWGVTAPPHPEDELGSSARFTTETRYIVIGEVSRADRRLLRAYDSRLQREVALRVLRADASSSETRERVLARVQALARLAHPNVIGVYDVQFVGSEVVIAIEAVQGVTLDEWLQTPRSWRAIIETFLAVGRGLAAAHAIDIPHGDFHPNHVIVGDDGRPRVTEIGFGRLSEAVASRDLSSTPGDPLVHSGRQASSYDLLAPEPCPTGVPDAKSDQYAFCLALWRALAGQQAPLENHQGAPDRRGLPPWPRAKRIPSSIRTILQRGLMIEPDDRWPSLAALLDALGEAITRGQRVPLIACVVVTPLLVAGAAWGVQHQRDAQHCTGAAAQLAGIWNGDRRDQMHAAMEATRVPYAPSVAHRVGSRVDDYVAKWAAMHSDACTASTIRGEQSHQVMDLRMACLHRAKVELRAAVDVMTHADVTVVERADQLVDSLPDVSRCADVEALSAEVSPPSSVDEAAVEAVRVKLADGRALRRAGKYYEAFARVVPLAEAASSVSYLPLQAEVQRELGLAAENIGKYADAETAFRAALRAAIASEQASAATGILAELMMTIGVRQLRPTEALAFAETAKAFLPSASPETEALLRSRLGEVLQVSEQPAEAEAEQRAAVAIAMRQLGPDHLQVAALRSRLANTLLCQARYAEAESELRASLEARRNALGEQHPSVALDHLNLGFAVQALGDPRRAETEYRTALEAYRDSLGPDAIQTGFAHGYLGDALLWQGRTAEAHAEYLESLRVGQLLPAEHVLQLLARIRVADAAWQLGHASKAEDPMKTAEAELKAALSMATRVFGPGNPEVLEMRPRLIQILLSEGRFAEAEAHARDVVTWSDQPQARRDLATALQGQGRFEAAEQELRAGLEFALSLPVPSAVDVADLRASLADTLEAQLRHREAERELCTALELRMDAYGPEHENVSSTLVAWARVVRKQHRLAEADLASRANAAEAVRERCENLPSAASEAVPAHAARRKG